MGKRGLSAVVTTLIMILLTLVAVGMMWLVVTNILKSSADEADIGKLTLKLSIEKVKVEGENVSITIKRSPGKGEMTSIKFVLKNDTDSVIVVKEGSLVELESKTFSINTTQEGITLPITEISMYAITKTGTGKEVPGLEYKYDVGTGTGSSSGTSCTPLTTCPANSCGSWLNGTCSGTLSCGTCTSGYTCNSTGMCVASCTPLTTCPANSCGSWLNGTCSGTLSCGTCTSGYTCNSTGMCVASCSPNCAGKVCGDNGCGGLCGGVTCLNYVKNTMKPVSWWKFDGNANDEMSINPGVLSGPTLTTGKFGGAYSFDGVNDYVNISVRNGLNSQTFTVSVWVNSSKISDNSMIIINFKTSSYYGGWGLAMDRSVLSCDNGDICLFLSKNTWGGYGYIDYAYNFPINTWTNWVATFNNSTKNITFYINGNPTYSVISSWYPVFDPAAQTTIGAWVSGNSYFNGTIDEVMIFNRSLSASEVSQIYAMNLSSG